MAVEAENLGVPDLQSPIRSDVNRKDVIDELGGSDQPFVETRLAEAAIERPALFCDSFPIAVIPSLFGRTTPSVVVLPGLWQVLVAVPITRGIGTATESTSFPQGARHKLVSLRWPRRGAGRATLVTGR
jgi:hypothetical protein